MAMEEIKRKLKDWFKIGLLYGLLATVLALVIKWLKIPLVNVTFSTVNVDVRNQIASGASTNLGQKVLGFFTGLTGFSFGNLITTLVSALLTVYIGAIVYGWIKGVYQAKTPVGRLTTVLLLGSVISGLIVSFAFSLPAFGVLAAMLLYFVIIAILMWLLSEKANLFRIPE